MTPRHEAFISAFNSIAVEAHIHARNKGFHDDADALQELANKNGMGEVCRKMRNSQFNALIISECGEALEGLRKDLPSEKLPSFTNEEEEYADALIRIADMAAARGMRIAEAVCAKLEYNPTREHRHGGKSF